ncbi:MAG: tRNA (adenosine(37)-N6)-threonylcarbamoyltransferase complex ATPase subunit type 1 TsaE [Candidatus Hydrogenedentes bacterium]|nr:tRNA (adenosine(37)-N6)-threonylcarbamoyltransferase complex ATPase subunit type 1 TsaE [Candidatus Hydrogenedentota bacterium]
MELTFRTESPEQTEAVGFLLGALVPRGTLIALEGDLAAGKTCLVRGMARFFAQNAPVHSPTFTLVNQYGSDTPLYHLDLYRLGGPEDLADLGYEELFEPDGVCVVEWSERAEGLLPVERIDIQLAHGGGDRRTFRMLNRGIVLPEDWDKQILSLLTKFGT